MNKFAETEEFYELYSRNVETVYQVAYLHLKNKSDAEDAVQNIFMKYLTCRPVFENRKHEAAWFVVASRNYCRDILRSWWKKKRTDEETEMMYEPFDMDTYGEVTEILMNLPDKYREVLYLYYYLEYSLKEIAEIMKKNENTVRTQLCRAREKMKKYLEKEETDYEQKRACEGV